MWSLFGYSIVDKVKIQSCGHSRKQYVVLCFKHSIFSNLNKKLIVIWDTQRYLRDWLLIYSKFHFLKYWISALRNFDCMEIFPSNSPNKRPPLVRSTMVIELSGEVSGVHLVWNHTRDFKIGRASSASSIWNHKSDLRSKLHDTKFNYHFITAIFCQYQYFIDQVAVCWKAETKKLSVHLWHRH